MQRGNVFVVSVFLSVCVSVQAVTFEADGIDTFFLAQWLMNTISISSLNTKVIGPRSRSKQAGGWPSTERYSCFLYCLLTICILLYFGFCYTYLCVYVIIYLSVYFYLFIFFN